MQTDIQRIEVTPKVGGGLRDVRGDNIKAQLKSEYDLETAKRLFAKHKFDLIPIIDNKGFLKEIIFWDTIFGQDIKRKTFQESVPVVIMAGGKGARLEPFTNILPKPLIPIHGKPIIQHIMESFFIKGIKDFFLSINYKNA